MENQKNERLIVYDDEGDRSAADSSGGSSTRNNYMAQYEAAQAKQRGMNEYEAPAKPANRTK